MLRTVKDIVKVFLPEPVIDAVLRRRQSRALAGISLRDFDTSRLLGAEQFDHRAIFGAPGDPDPEWDADHLAIQRQTTAGSIGSAVSPGDRRALYHVVRHFKPKRILEFGTHLGMSTCYLARAQASNGTGSLTTVDIIDVNSDAGAWGSAGLGRPPAEVVEALGLGGQVDFVTQPSAEFMARHTGTYDLIFLDGDHEASAVYQEVSWGLTRLNPGGLILLHDYFPGRRPLFDDLPVVQGPYLAYERIRREAPSVAVVPFSPLPWITRMRTLNTSLAALVRI